MHEIAKGLNPADASRLHLRWSKQRNRQSRAEKEYHIPTYHSTHDKVIQYCNHEEMMYYQ